MRGIRKALVGGVKSIFSNWKMWLLVYGTNVFFALFIALPFNAFFKDSIGTSLEVNESLKRFDYTFISDFLNEYGFGFNQILKQSYFVVALFLLLSIFLSGGIVETFLNRNNKFSFSSFWKACHHHFWRMFRLAIYYLLMHLLLLLVFFQIFSIGGLSPFELESDAVVISRVVWVGGFYVLFFALFMMFHDYAKIKVVQADERWMTKPALAGLGFTFRHFISCFILFLIQALFFLLLTFIYVTIRKQFFMSSEGSILLGLFLGQVYLLGRMGVKLLRLGVAARFVDIVIP